jgi:hypothetical protein
MGRRAIDAVVDGDIEPGRQQSFIRRRIDELTKELDRMKQLLSNDAREDAQG